MLISQMCLLTIELKHCNEIIKYAQEGNILTLIATTLLVYEWDGMIIILFVLFYLLIFS